MAGIIRTICWEKGDYVLIRDYKYCVIQTIIVRIIHFDNFKYSTLLTSAGLSAVLDLEVSQFVKYDVDHNIQYIYVFSMIPIWLSKLNSKFL